MFIVVQNMDHYEYRTILGGGVVHETKDAELSAEK